MFLTSNIYGTWCENSTQVYKCECVKNIFPGETVYLLSWVCVSLGPPRKRTHDQKKMYQRFRTSWKNKIKIWKDWESLLGHRVVLSFREERTDTEALNMKELWQKIAVPRKDSESCLRVLKAQDGSEESHLLLGWYSQSGPTWPLQCKH